MDERRYLLLFHFAHLVRFHLSKPAPFIDEGALRGICHALFEVRTAHSAIGPRLRLQSGLMDDMVLIRAISTPTLNLLLFISCRVRVWAKMVAHSSDPSMRLRRGYVMSLHRMLIGQESRIQTFEKSRIARQRPTLNSLLPERFLTRTICTFLGEALEGVRAQSPNVVGRRGRVQNICSVREYAYRGKNVDAYSQLYNAAMIR